jgi:hypothetical protein
MEQCSRGGRPDRTNRSRSTQSGCVGGAQEPRPQHVRHRRRRPSARRDARNSPSEPRRTTASDGVDRARRSRSVRDAHRAGFPCVQAECSPGQVRRSTGPGQCTDDLGKLPPCPLWPRPGRPHRRPTGTSGDRDGNRRTAQPSETGADRPAWAGGVWGGGDLMLDVVLAPDSPLEDGTMSPSRGSPWSRA